MRWVDPLSMATCVSLKMKIRFLVSRDAVAIVVFSEGGHNGETQHCTRLMIVILLANELSDSNNDHRLHVLLIIT